MQNQQRKVDEALKNVYNGNKINIIKFLVYVVLGIHIMEFLFIDVQDYSLKLKGRGWNSKIINLLLFLIVEKEISKTIFAGYFFYFAISTIIYTLKVKKAMNL